MAHVPDRSHLNSGRERTSSKVKSNRSSLHRHDEEFSFLTLEQALPTFVNYSETLTSLARNIERFWRALPRDLEKATAVGNSANRTLSKLNALSRRCLTDMSNTLQENFLHHKDHAPKLIFGPSAPFVKTGEFPKLAFERSTTTDAPTTNHVTSNDTTQQIGISLGNNHALHINYCDLFSTCPAYGLLANTPFALYPRFLTLLASPLMIVADPTALLRFGDNRQDTFARTVDDSDTAITGGYQKSDLHALKRSLKALYYNICGLRNEQHTFVELLYMRKSLSETTRIRQAAIPIEVPNEASSLSSEGRGLVTLRRRQSDVQNARTTYGRHFGSVMGPFS